MGSSSNESNSLIVCNMKYLAILAIALFAIVAAEPEAEADAEAAAAYYGGYYGRGYGYGYGYGLGHRGYYGGYYGHGLYGRGYGYGHYLGKRSADANLKQMPHPHSTPMLSVLILMVSVPMVPTLMLLADTTVTTLLS